MTPRRAPWAAVLAALLAVPLLAAPAGADAPATDPAPVTAEETAEAALAAVEEIIESGAAAADSGDAGTGDAGDPDATDGTHDADHTGDEPATEGLRAGGKDLTLALRDLAAARSDLPKSKREAAGRLLARPDDSLVVCNDRDEGDLVCYGGREGVKRTCNSMLCVHWVNRKTSARHGVPGENDGPGGRYPGKAGGAPDYVEFVLSTLTRVAQTYRKAGYRDVLSDGTKGGDARPDIYLGELGDLGAYGYCTTDDHSVTEHVPAPAYCVLDNDYAEFGIAPRSALRATAAHEWFHAVQFAYDLNEDAWLMEATATWIEDQVFDGINDNRNYLPYGPLALPHQSLDLYSQLSQYGSWIFFQFLGERYPSSAGGMPIIVREIWRRLAHDGGVGAKGMYSVEAVRSSLSKRGSSLATELSKFTIWNRRPAAFYDEGAAYRASPTRRTFNLRGGAPAGSFRFRLDHLAASTVRFIRGSGLTKRHWVQLKLNLNDRAVGSRAVLTVKRKGKAAKTSMVSLNVHGNRAFDVRFGPAVQWIDVTVLNTSTRFGGCDDPDRDASTTCHGFARDDNRLQAVTGRAYRR
ncbi:MXAN_6640 family putative metalloprotease [Nocardioides sp. J54]|uniref:MXAN_6640 family putative metalloprotease n=1 Tax=Nocardioides sp. J54 TaxID=935866 RepID=UPI0012FABC31|nr:MXAN_6640 family putative metalloprotease [Nocardioides sp. J54]